MVNIFSKYNAHSKSLALAVMRSLWLASVLPLEYKVRFIILLALTGESPKFCQIYFINNEESQVATRCAFVDGLRYDIVSNIINC